MCCKSLLFKLVTYVALTHSGVLQLCASSSSFDCGLSSDPNGRFRAVILAPPVPGVGREAPDALLVTSRSGYSRRHFIRSIAARLRRFTTTLEGTQRPPWSTNLGAEATMVAWRAGGPRAGASANSARAR